MDGNGVGEGMKAKPSKDFEIFKREFTKCQKRFGLNDYKVYFKHEACGSDNYAQIITNQPCMVATVTLNTNLTAVDKRLGNVKETAKHEACHLLVYRLENIAICRYIDESEIIEATEALVRRIQGLIE